MAGFLSVPDFERWQHYKDRTPPWIKLHRDMLLNYDFSRLRDASKAHLIHIWVLASQMDNKFPNDPEWIGEKIGANEAINLKYLVDKGFLLPDSEALAYYKQSAMRETEADLSDITNVISSGGEVQPEQKTGDFEKGSPKSTIYEIEGISLTFDQFFEKLWDHYPKIRDKGHKGKARDQLALVLKKGGKHETDWNRQARAIADSVRRFRRYCETTGEKNPDAFRWLRDGGYDRAYSAAAPGGRSPGYSLEAVHAQAVADQTGRPEGRAERLERLGLGDGPGDN